MSEREEMPTKERRTGRTIGLIAVGVVAVLTAAVTFPLFATSTPDFFSRYHLLERRYVNLEGSAHEGIGCRTCHETQPLENGVALVGDFYRSLVTTDQVPAYFSFAPPTNDACLQCHSDSWANKAERIDRIPHPAHLRVSEETRECVSCHKWTGHFETYMIKHKEMPFSGVCVAYGCHVGTKTSDECFDCHHVLHESGEEWTTHHPQVVAETGQNPCLEGCHQINQCQQCHTTGERPEFEGQTIEISMKQIEELHVKDDWTERYHGAEALKNQDNCMLCHQEEGECNECHLQRPAFHGSTETWIGRHSKQSDTVDDPGCLTCHEKPWCEECHDQFKEME